MLSTVSVAQNMDLSRCFYLKERLTTSPPLSVIDAQGGIFFQVLAGILGHQLGHRKAREICESRLLLFMVADERCRTWRGDVHLLWHIVYHG